MALPNIHQIFGDNPAEYPRLVCVMTRGFSPLEGRMWRVCIGGNAGLAPSRTAPWETQWGQLNQLLAALVPCVLTKQVIGAALATPYLVYSALFGGRTCALRRPGLRLLPG